MIAFVAAFGAAFVVMAVLDGLWLGLVARDLYRRHLGFLMADQVNWTAAGIFYLTYAAGLAFFVVQPGVESGSALSALWRGAAFGFVAYATYDLTNLATVRGWPLPITLIDLAWGALLSAAVGWVATSLLLRVG